MNQCGVISTYLCLESFLSNVCVCVVSSRDTITSPLQPHLVGDEESREGAMVIWRGGQIGNGWV